MKKFFLSENISFSDKTRFVVCVILLLIIPLSILFSESNVVAFISGVLFAVLMGETLDLFNEWRHKI